MSYITINQFGGQQQQNDPATICAFSMNIDKSFEGGVLGYSLGANSKGCQLYMAQRSAKDWDAFAEYLSYNQEKLPTMINQGCVSTACGSRYGASSSSCGNLAAASSYGPSYNPAHNGIKNLGDAFLINTAYEKYCTFPGAVYKDMYVNPIDASSPIVRERIGGNPVCTVNPNTIDQDILMEKITHRQIGDDLLINIWNTSLQKGINIADTKVGRYIQQYVLPLYS